MTNFTKIVLSVAAIASLNACGGGSSSSTPTAPVDPIDPSSTILSGELTGDTLLTADKTWELNGKVVVPSGATLKIEAGTTVVGMEGTDAWLMVLPGGQLIAEGTAIDPITFTSSEAVALDPEAPGQWGGVTIIGNSDNDQTTTYEVDDVTEAGTSNATSGSLKHVIINNTGISVEQNKEINGLSLFGVSASTIVDNITVNRSGDDGIEIWGGAVNLTNITINGAQDDSFDTDSGWIGTVDGLTITDGIKAGIEMSGITVATYKNVNINIPATSTGSEGGLYFKAGSGENVGGKFENVVVTYNPIDAAGGMMVSGLFNELTSTMTNVKLEGANTAIVPKDPLNVVDVAQAVEVQAMYDDNLL